MISGNLLYNLPVAKTKTKTAYLALRVTEECKALFEEVARRRGISQASVAEILVREYAERHGIVTPSSETVAESKEAYRTDSDPSKQEEGGGQEAG